MQHKRNYETRLQERERERVNFVRRGVMSMSNANSQTPRARPQTKKKNKKENDGIEDSSETRKRIVFAILHLRLKSEFSLSSRTCNYARI
jgi:hypothetical protein